jgi:protein TonB
MIRSGQNSADVFAPSNAARGHAADLHDAARRWRAAATVSADDSADLTNVVRFARNRRDAGAQPAPEPKAGTRTAGAMAAPDHILRWSVIVAVSIAAHLTFHLPFQREPAPLASIGEISISVELVPGADQAAGLIPDQGTADASAPVPAQTPESVAEEISEPVAPTTPTAAAQIRLPAETEPQQSLQEAPTQPAETHAEAVAEAQPDQPAELPPEQPPAAPRTASPVEPVAEEPPTPAVIQAAPQAIAGGELQASVNPEPSAEIKAAERSEPPPLPPERPARLGRPVQEKPKRALVREKRKPETRRAAARGERNDSRTTAPASAAAGGVGRGRSDADSNYRGRVAAHLARHKRFPADARSRGDQGSAMVTFAIDGNGRVTSVRLARGAGAPTLDREAIAMVHRASPFPPPPGGRGMSFSVPVSFRIN